jgi:hypothetical protein
LISGIIVLVALMGLIAVLQHGGITSGMTSAFSVIDLTPKDFKYEEPDDLSKEAAEEAIKKAELEIEKMKELNLPILFSSDALKEAKNSFNEEDYEQVFKVTQLISYTKKQKLDFKEKIK